MRYFPDGAHEQFRVKPGSFYSLQVPIKNKIDGGGNISGRNLLLYSTPIVYVKQYLTGNLVRVTDDPTQAVDFGEPKGAAEPVAETETPEVETFVEDEQAVFAPPVDDAEPVEEPEPEPEPKKRNPGRPKGSKNKNQGGSK